MSEDQSQPAGGEPELPLEQQGLVQDPHLVPAGVAGGWPDMRQGAPVGPGGWMDPALPPVLKPYVPSGWLSLPVALLGFIVATVLGLVLTGVYLIFNHAGLSLDDPEALERELLSDTGVVVISSVGLWLGLLGTCWLWSAKFMKEKFLDFYALRRPAWTTLLYGVAGGLLLRGIATVAGIFIPAQEVDGRDYSNNTDVITEAIGDPWKMLAVALFVVVGAPIFEELFFRGMLFSSLLRSTKLWLAVAVSSVLFGLVHYQGGGSAGIALTLVTGGAGVGLALIRYRTGSLMAGMVAHGVFNAVAVILVFFFGLEG